MRRTIIATLAALTALTMALPAGAEKPAFAGPPVEGTIVDTAVALSGTPYEFDANPSDFDILVAAVLATGLDGALSGNNNLTVFAPTDQAFLDVASALTKQTVTDEEVAFNAVAGLGIPAVTDILLYHVTDGVRPSPSVLNVPAMKMLNGERVSVHGTVLNDGQASITGADAARVSNGLIHVIDGVLLP